MIVSWFSAGVSSFIATYLCRGMVDKVNYCHIDDQHDDTLRFLHDCEKCLGGKFDIMQSPYKSVDNVIETFRFINSRYGAKCTEILKKRVRKEWECGRKNLTYIWGFDVAERDRAEQTVEMMPEFKHLFPLIDNNLTKADCHGMAANLCVKRPKMYDLGYQNNNCRGCVKGGMGYWNKTRIDFPEVFERRSRQERDIGHTCINGIYLDELPPNKGNMQKEILEECSFVCRAAQMEVAPCE